MNETKVSSFLSETFDEALRGSKSYQILSRWKAHTHQKAISEF